jgi:hypothetical protein
MSWPTRDMFAVTIDGKILLNAKAIDGVDLAKLVRKKGVFIGVPLQVRELHLLLRRLSEASSEAAAYISGGRSRQRRLRTTARSKRKTAS